MTEVDDLSYEYAVSLDIGYNPSQIFLILAVVNDSSEILFLSLPLYVGKYKIVDCSLLEIDNT